MKIVKLAALGIVAMLLLSACGLLNNFIPNQSAEDVFGLDDASVTLTATAPAGLGTQAVTFAGTADGSFADIDASGVPAGVRPSSIEETIALGGTITVNFAADAAQPETITIVGASLRLTLDDASSDAVSKTVSAPDGLSLAFTKGTCDGTAPDTCTYTAGADTVALLTAVLDGADMDAAWDIMTNGDDSNTVTGYFSVTLDQDVSATAIVVTIQTSDGTIKFG